MERDGDNAGDDHDEKTETEEPPIHSIPGAGFGA